MFELLRSKRRDTGQRGSLEEGLRGEGRVGVVVPGFSEEGIRGDSKLVSGTVLRSEPLDLDITISASCEAYERAVSSSIESSLFLLCPSASAEKERKLKELPRGIEKESSRGLLLDFLISSVGTENESLLGTEKDNELSEGAKNDFPGNENEDVVWNENELPDSLLNDDNGVDIGKSPPAPRHEEGLKTGMKRV